ncbi:conserved hypothetical protein [Candidatus Sulfopaludibacter sp. SbA3]|nr:conserved hypothetical protein [Candidatus Sulfopaludibacter sp. SbA3]
MPVASQVPCRLSVILARRAPIGVVFRRASGNWVQLLNWRTGRDTFDEGQWFRCKVDANRSDLSPSGDKLVYFAASYRSRSADRGYGETWTAVSRPPYFTALALWPLGDTWFGGGLFDDDTCLRLNHPAWKAQCHPNHPATGLHVTTDEMYFWDRSPLSERMTRDGWMLRTKVKTIVGGRKIAGTYPQQWEKPDLKARRSLFLHDLNDGLIHHRPFHYSVVYGKTASEIVAFEAEWADWDQAGKLAYASRGKLFRVTFTPRGRSAETREIADFSVARPDPQPAPEWATHW